MKKLSLFALAAIIFGMMSCDKLKEPYFTEPIVQVSDTIKLDDPDTINFDGKMVTLLEDFTGVKCPNCPNAAEVANNLQSQYGEHLVVLGVHPNSGMSYQDPNGGFPDFRTDDGEVWRQYFGIQGFPNGLVNRRGGMQPHDSWTALVTSSIAEDTPVRLVVKTAFDDATRELKISVHSLFLQNVDSDDVRLTVCMMEDNIIGKQIGSSGQIPEYVHRHVFRGTVDGMPWGRKLDDEATSIASGRRFVTNMKFTLSENYNAEEFYIVAFVSDNNNKEVLMAAETKIK